MHWKKRGIFILLIVVLLGLVPLSGLRAQDGITIQVGLPELMRNFLSDDAFAQFEADNPGVKVKLVYTGFEALFVTPAINDLDEHLETIQEYVSQADVVLTSASNLTTEGTRAGYFLDLSPLTNADSSLNIADFVPAAWQSFQWDGGVWALPLSVDLIGVVYNPAVFDEAGLAYPNEAWTLDDFANAARRLAEYDSSGAVTTPGLITFSNGKYLVRALTGHGFYDDSTIPDTPSLDDPALASLLTSWAELESEGVISSAFSGEISSVPFSIFGSFRLRGPSVDGQEQSAAAMLPGGTAGLDVYGFSVSSGTQYPELAYELAKYLTYNVQLANGLFGIAPARRSLEGVEPTGNGGAQIVRIPGNLSPETQALVDQALANALPVAEMRYSDYVMSALNAVVEDGLDATTALRDAEAAAVTNLQSAADRRSTTTVFVATPVPDIVLQPGEVELKFGMTSFVQPMPNQELWEQLMQDFAASDPQVGKVTMDMAFGDLSNSAETFDCFYLPYNAVPNLDTALVLNLDPFLDVDPTFDRGDLVGNVMSMVQLDGRTWALPIVIFPEVLRYHAELFAKVGVPEPTNGWTIDQFSDALRALKPTLDDDAAPFVPRGAGGGYLSQLMAAYGGLPIDRRTNPPTLNYTDPETIEAIRQVLDLAKEGYLEYQELARTAFLMMAINSEILDPIYNQTVNFFGLRQEINIGDGGVAEDPYRTTSYPTGRYNSLSYDMGTAYISATTQNADACYRWISTISQHPELFSGMPARRSVIDDPTFAAEQGEDVVAVYRRFDALMSDPNTINLQTPFSGGTNPGNFLLEFWLNRAFDRYVLEDADLEAELTEAYNFATAYQECVANIPPFDAATQERGEYMQQFFGCASSTDPTVANLFAGPG